MTDKNIEEVKKILNKALFSCESKGDYSVCLPHINNEDIIAQQIDGYYSQLFSVDDKDLEKIAYWFYEREAKAEGMKSWHKWEEIDPEIQAYYLELANQIPSKPVKLRRWISVRDSLPSGQWSAPYSHWSEEVLIANSCSISIGYYDRDNEAWYVAEGTFGVNKERIDKITHWMPLPVNPHDKSDNPTITFEEE